MERQDKCSKTRYYLALLISICMRISPKWFRERLAIAEEYLTATRQLNNYLNEQELKPVEAPELKSKVETLRLATKLSTAPLSESLGIDQLTTHRMLKKPEEKNPEPPSLDEALCQLNYGRSRESAEDFYRKAIVQSNNLLVLLGRDTTWLDEIYEKSSSTISWSDKFEDVIEVRNVRTPFGYRKLLVPTSYNRLENRTAGESYRRVNLISKNAYTRIAHEIEALKSMGLEPLDITSWK